MFSLSKANYFLLLNKFVKHQYFRKDNFFKTCSVFQSNMLLKDFLSKLKEKIPLEYAADWDNVGLLVEPSDPFNVKTILLTNDLTEPVLDEAIDKNVNMIISYHPPIFRPFKSITQKNWKERIIAKCLLNQIAVYSPHTALDAIQGGINEWLLKPFDCVDMKPIENTLISAPYEFNISLEVKEKSIIESLKNKQLSIFIHQQQENGNLYSISCTMNQLALILDFLGNVQGDSIRVLAINKAPQIPLLNEGMGRIGQLVNPMTINQIISTLKQNLGLDKLRLALGKDHNQDTLIKSIGVCAGSGASLLRQAKADFMITGEMSHHEILDLVHQGISVALCEHSNTERGYLKTSLLDYLVENYPDVVVIMSQVDKDPIDIV